MRYDEENCRLFGKGYQCNDYVFKWPDGRPFEPDYVTHHFAKVLARNGLEHIRFHELRHTFATMALQNGVDVKTVSSMLGHYSADLPLFPSKPARFFRVLGQNWVRNRGIPILLVWR